MTVKEKKRQKHDASDNGAGEKQKLKAKDYEEELEKLHIELV